MGKTAINLAIVLGLITIAFAGYYMYVQRSATTLSSEATDQTIQNVKNDTQKFIQHRIVLEKITMDISILESDKFTSLRSYTTPILEQPIGREDPFADVDIGEINSI